MADDAGAAADKEFKLGKSLERSAPEQSCEHYRKSMDLAPSATVLVLIAECAERSGKLRSADADLHRALELNEAMNADRPQHQIKLRKVIVAAIEKLERTAPRVSLSVSPRAEGLTLLLDGEPISVTEIDTPTLVDRTDGHELVARAPGFQERRATGDDSISVVLERLPADPVPLPRAPVSIPPTMGEAVQATPHPAPPPDHAATRTDARQHETAKRDNGRRFGGYAAGGIGVAALGVAGYLGLRTLWLVHDADPHCAADGCDDAGFEKLQQARRTQTAGFIAAGAGLLFAGSGLWLVLTAPTQDRPAAHAHNSLVVGLGSGGAELRGTW